MSHEKDRVCSRSLIASRSKCAGKVEGIEQGKEAGELKGKLKTAKNMLAMGLSIEQAAQATGLSEEVIKNAT